MVSSTLGNYQKRAFYFCQQYRKKSLQQSNLELQLDYNRLIIFLNLLGNNSNLQIAEPQRQGIIQYLNDKNEIFDCYTTQRLLSYQLQSILQKKHVICFQRVELHQQKRYISLTLYATKKIDQIQNKVEKNILIPIRSIYSMHSINVSTLFLNPQQQTPLLYRPKIHSYALQLIVWRYLNTLNRATPIINTYFTAMESDSSDDQYGSNSDDELYIDQAQNSQNPLKYIDRESLELFPHNAIGAITFKRHIKGSLVSNGTGFLVAPSLVLTVAHCVFDKRLKKQHLDIEFYPSLHGRLSNPIKVIDVRVPQQFMTLQKEILDRKGGIKYDYALLKLEKDVKLQQYFKLVHKFNNDYQKISIYGYPGLMKEEEQIIGKQAGSQGQQCTSIIKIDSKTMRLKHSLSSVSGHSGGPLLMENNQVVGLHKCLITGKTGNCGVLINSQMIENIKRWQTQFNQQRMPQIQIKEYLVQRSMDQSRIMVRTCHQRVGFTQICKIDECKYKEFPFNCIGQLLMECKDSNSSQINTAFLISENLILTCLSSIYNPAIKDFGPNNPDLGIYFIPSSTANQHKKIPIESFCFNKEALNLRKWNSPKRIKVQQMLQDVFFDYCLLKLTQKIQLQSYMQILVNYDKEWTQFQLYGCPKQADSGNQLLKLSGASSSELNVYIDKHIVLHNLDTGQGMMGSPLFIDKNKVIAIHKLKLKTKVKCKGARLITIDMVNKLYEWNKQLKGTPFIAKYYIDNQIEETTSIRQLEELHQRKKDSIRQSKMKQQN